MAVERLSKRALQKLLSGKVKADVEDSMSIVVQFYKNDCHYCHALSEEYVKMADEHNDNETMFFFAFNIADYADIEKILGFQGVPTICVLNINKYEPRIRVMSDPQKPNDKTWYHIKDIKEFIEKEKQK
tara:strand:- start:1401 stop:1787 length:387 start_codon:yes stop_codon:yes gene_type:complete